ncbi:mycothione reductase [Flaviflexus salsibiostraticola]|uniref:Mycothione reductase n=1 Tax=Flaviflexus salsibiostraticola TaxID=1282737 RepID=A0A3S8Z736_9ACTO|nr:mycothione reductase [Flaviflexus salsibiostraticola]AZN29322.1 mycothione reductase [Flaviflexus salsibiostraticola]
MTHYDLLIIGTGSGNSLPGPEFDDLSIALVEKGLFGGTCLNAGCIPTKMFTYTAEIANTPARAPKYGVSETLDCVDWPAIRDRVFGRIDPIAAGGEEYRKVHEDNRNLTVYQGIGRFTGPKSMVVATADGDREITADRIVIAAGSRPAFPAVAGLAESNPLTSDSVMRMERLPGSMIIIGSGFIGAEMAHIFSSLGVDVTLIARSPVLLRHHDRDIADAYTQIASGRYRVKLRFSTGRVERRDGRVFVSGRVGDAKETLEADELLVATGRIPNSDTLDVAAAGIGTHPDGRVMVDDYQRVLDPQGEVMDGIFALGDISSDWQLKHVANKEAKTVRHNLLHPDAMKATDHRFVPHAVFGDPQIAAVGMTEAEAQLKGLDIIVARQEYAGIAYGWAMEDTTGFAKIIADRETTEILGAHIMGPHAPTLIQLLIQAMSTGQTVRDIVDTQYWIHPAMPELIENALLQITG